MQRINRKEYLDYLIRHKDRDVIKVVSGIRRCGKSTLFEIYKDYLRENGVDEQQIISVNFEELDYEHLKNYRDLYEYIKTRLISGKMNYVFLDEVQHVEQFEKVVDSLHIKENVDMYITGSNAYFMSGELATLLTGRYVELKMLPLSFKEFCDGINQTMDGIALTKAEKYTRYLSQSSFPFVLQLDGRQQEIREYLEGIYSSILLKDIVARKRINDVMMLESVIRFVFDNVGNILSTRKIVGAMTSQGRKIDGKTVEKYLQGLMDSLVVYQARRYNIKGKQYLATQEKYYLADLGLRNYLLGYKATDQGHLLENVIYLELLRRGYDVYVGQITDGEVDFVAMTADRIEYYQVSATVLDVNTLKRELKSLQNIPDSYQKYLLTLDEVGANSNHEGIRQLNALDWLLGNYIE